VRHTLGIAAFTYAIDRGSAWGWLNGRTLVLAGAGVGLVVLFLLPERRARDPLIDLGLFRNVPYVIVTAAGAVGEHRVLPDVVSVDDLPPSRSAGCPR
jgi:hypothetical protein